VPGDEAFPRSRLPVDHHVVRRIVSYDGSDLLGHRLDLRVAADDTVFLRDVTDVEEFLSGEDRILICEQWIPPATAILA